MKKYWIAVACYEHVQKGVKEGIMQVCHGKQGPLKRMTPGDYIIYYSPVIKFGKKDICRKFTALGKILNKEPYQYQMTKTFIPWRRDVDYLLSEEVAIVPLLDKLSFIVNKQRWGFPFRRGCFEINEKDFILIAQAMKVFFNEKCKS